MPYEYLASVQSAVRRVNERIKTLVSHFGSDSAIVNDITSKIDVLLRDNYRFKNGVAQIIKPSKIYNDEEKMQALYDIESNMKTWGAYRKEYDLQYEQYKEQAEFFKNEPADISAFIQTHEKLSEALTQFDSSQLPDEALEILQKKNGRKTYVELSQVVNILSAKGVI